MKTAPVLVIALVATGAADAFAAQPAPPAPDRGFYVLGAAGRASVDIDNGAIDASVRAAGALTSNTTSDEKVSAWKLAVGYQFNRNFALELSYADFDNFKLETVTTGPAGVANGRIDGKAYSLDAIGIIPVSANVDLFGRLGFHRWDVDTRVAAVIGGATATANASENGTDWKFGLGARWNFNRNLGLQLEWERFNDVGDANATGRSDVDLVTLGLRWKF